MSAAGAIALAMSALVALLPGVPASLGPQAATSGDLADALHAAGAGEQLSVIVHLSEHEAAPRVLDVLGDRPGFGFRTVPALAFQATPHEIAVLRSMPAVTYLELGGHEPMLLDTATVASRARAVWDDLGTGPILHPVTGERIDGAGVGIAIVDGGVLATHPDLGANVVMNFRVTPADSLYAWFFDDHTGAGDLLVPTPQSDVASGHGTHVASIAAGTGASSGGRHQGAAPGAGLYGFGTGAGLSIFVPAAAAAFDWVVQNHDQVDPPVRIVSNSWGGAGNFNPDLLSSKLMSALVDEGVVVVFAAGNDGGDGFDDNVNAYAKHPSPGVIGVANYDDGNSGTRNGPLADSSSRGDADQPSTWPDLSAPGTNILAAFDPSGPVGWLGKPFDVFDAVFDPSGAPGSDGANPWLTTMTGTSMAAPHVAGVAALVLQANPGLSPAQVEDVLEDASYKFAFGTPYQADPANLDDTSSFDKGHGLVDAEAAVLRALALT